MNRQDFGIEIKALHAQMQAFEQSKAAAVQELHHQVKQRCTVASAYIPQERNENLNIANARPIQKSSKSKLAHGVIDLGLNIEAVLFNFSLDGK